MCVSESRALGAAASVELSSESSRNSKAGVRVGKEHGRVLLDLLERESLAGVLAVLDDSRAERALEAADRGAAAALANGVGEGNAKAHAMLVSLSSVKGAV